MMERLLHSACGELIDGLNWAPGAAQRLAAAEHIDEARVADPSVFVSNVVFRSLLPWRDYDRREQAPSAQREVTLSAPVFVHIKKETEAKQETTSTGDRKRKREDDDNNSRKTAGTQILALDEMPEMQLKTEETKKINASTTATTVSDANSAEARAAMQRNIGEATSAIRARLAAQFAHDARVARSDVAKLARTIVILLLEPIALRIISVVQRPDADVLAREMARLSSGEKPSVEDRRAMNRHVQMLSINLFAGLPELALDLIKLESPAVLRAVYFFVVFSEVLFVTREESATTHVLDDFRHNSVLEKLLERGEFIGRTLCALLRGVNEAYRLTLRKRLMMALDAAMSEVSAMRQPYNRSPANIERLGRAKQIVSEFSLV